MCRKASMYSLRGQEPVRTQEKQSLRRKELLQPLCSGCGSRRLALCRSETRDGGSGKPVCYKEAMWPLCAEGVQSVCGEEPVQPL